MKINSHLKRLNLSDHDLEDMLLNSEFTDKGWFFHGNLKVSMQDFYTVYREILLDGLMPTACVSGIGIS